MTNAKPAADYFTRSETEMVACPRCADGRKDPHGCKLCSESRRVYRAMAAVYQVEGVKGAWAWFNAKLDAKVGVIITRTDGSLEAWGYVLHDASKPDTYRNRKWYQAAVEATTPTELARKIFGQGRLRFDPSHHGTPGWAVLR